MRFNEIESSFLHNVTQSPVEAGELHWLKTNLVPFAIAYTSLGMIASGSSWATSVGEFIFVAAQLLTMISIICLHAGMRRDPVTRFVFLANHFIRHGHSWLGYCARWAIITGLPVCLVMNNTESWWLLGLYLIVWVAGSHAMHRCFAAAYHDLPVIMDWDENMREELANYLEGRPSLLD